MVGRLKPGISPSQAHSDAQRVAQDIMRNFPAEIASLRISSVVRPLQEETVEQSRPLLKTLFLAVAFSVASRVREMAIRMALGSQRSGILRLILVSGAKLAAVGCVLGLAGAVADSTLLRSLLFGVGPFDPPVLLLAAVGVLLLAVSASMLPALRAASIDPMQALRGE